jgi:hypothetical protein
LSLLASLERWSDSYPFLSMTLNFSNYLASCTKHISKDHFSIFADDNNNIYEQCCLCYIWKYSIKISIAEYFIWNRKKMKLYFVQCGCEWNTSWIEILRKMGLKFTFIFLNNSSSTKSFTRIVKHNPLMKTRL